MKVLNLIFFICCISLSSIAQRAPITDLPSASLGDAGFNIDSITALIPILDNFEQLDFRGLIVIKNNNIVMEWYYNSNSRSDINDIRSAGKSITALLLGVAIKDGLVKNLDQDVYSFFPKEKYPSIHEDYRKVKIKHLLDMSSGLDADSNDWRTPGNAGQWMGKDEWVKYLLTIPLAKQPGTQWIYADINAALIGAIIEETSGMSLNDYAKKKVFTPLGIKKYYWQTNLANQTVAAGNLFISALDLAKLGVLVANEGKWVNNQIVPADYIEKLIDHKVFDLTEMSAIASSYGMLWYKAQKTYNDKTIDFLYASGNGGNYLVVVPKENMVIALTSTAYGTGYGHRRAHTVIHKLLSALE